MTLACEDANSKLVDVVTVADVDDVDDEDRVQGCISCGILLSGT